MTERGAKPTLPVAAGNDTHKERNPVGNIDVFLWGVLRTRIVSSGTD